MEQPNDTHLIQKAKKMFPNMPDEVFDAWLLPIIRNHNAWPYLNIFSPHPSDQWRRYFGLFTLNDISNCLWHKFNLSFDMGCLDPLSNSVIETLIKDHVHNLETPIRFNVQNSKIRFIGFVKFIQRTGTIPAPIIGINTDEGFRVLDGNHRLATLTYLGLRGRIRCAAWLGHPPI